MRRNLSRPISVRRAAIAMAVMTAALAENTAKNWIAVMVQRG
jgi:hypothetical protein